MINLQISTLLIDLESSSLLNVASMLVMILGVPLWIVRPMLVCSSLSHGFLLCLLN
jgi:hypothetical protein